VAKIIYHFPLKNIGRKRGDGIMGIATGLLQKGAQATKEWASFYLYIMFEQHL
jgi:hypothetical protein